MSIAPVLVVHGGAGNVHPSNAQFVVECVRDAAVAGYAVLKRGGGCMDGVEAAIR